MIIEDHIPQKKTTLNNPCIISLLAFFYLIWSNICLSGNGGCLLFSVVGDFVTFCSVCVQFCFVASGNERIWLYDCDLYIYIYIKNNIYDYFTCYQRHKLYVYESVNVSCMANVPPFIIIIISGALSLVVLTLGFVICCLFNCWLFNCGVFTLARVNKNN